MVQNQDIAHYHVTGKIGAGAMGEVYSALDTKLGREVAIKVLPASFAARKGSLARFEREAKLLASLNHAHIATIFGVEEHNRSLAIVMELVQGQTLAERLEGGPMELKEAIFVFGQIAEALGAAHDRGIVHRDLKPGNIKFDADGEVKILDFGLAKAVENLEESAKTDDEASTLPVDTTVPGMIVGTPAYMSPEQARGEPVDRRTDVWAFGCCLYEALTGRKPFEAKTVSEMMADILKSEPDYALLPAETPPEIRSLLRHCLEKDPRRRFRDIADIGIRLEDTTEPERLPVRDGKASGAWVKTGILVLAVAAGTALLMWGVYSERSSEAPPGLPELREAGRHLQIDLGLASSASLPIDRGTALRLSPDGMMLAYIRRVPGALDRLYVQSLSQPEFGEALPLEGTEGAYSFCFSPTGERIAFLVPEPGNSSQSQLKIVPAGGGGALMVKGDLHTPADVMWEGDWIVFAEGSDTTGTVVRVSTTEIDGEVEELTQLGGGERIHRAPQLLPGGGAVLYTAHSNSSDFRKAKFMMKDLRSGGEPRLLWDRGGYDVRYLEGGYLVFVLNGTLFSSRFDPDSPGRLNPEPVIKNVVSHRNQARAQFDISDDGTLVYLKGEADQYHWHFTEPLPPTQLEWIDRKGNSELVLEADYFGQFDVSPDGNLLAVARSDGTQWDLYVYNLEDRTTPPKQMTFGVSDEKLPVWGPDGESILFASNAEGVVSVFSVPLDKPGEVHRVTKVKTDVAARFQTPLEVDSRGKRLIIFEAGPVTSEDLRTVQLKWDEETGWIEDTVADFRATVASETGASISPDGEWVAYVSNANRSHSEIFVCRFSQEPVTRAGKGQGRQISSLGTDVVVPRWVAGAPPSLLFSNLSGHVYTTPIRFEGDDIVPGGAVEWPGGTYHLIEKMCGYDVDPSGDRILVRKLAESPSGQSAGQSVSRVVLFEGFRDHLDAVLPRKEGGSAN